ncbi:hypothetical protein PGQ11_002427 [Apiospora arundinis]|uniref:CASP-like protein n=1 Tax=Apiospora arundinis TaxID=335852 RepID=A0ABR2JIW4_9PEZI
MGSTAPSATPREGLPIVPPFPPVHPMTNRPPRPAPPVPSPVPVKTQQQRPAAPSVKSPNPNTSRGCLGLAVVIAITLVVAYREKDLPNPGYSEGILFFSKFFSTGGSGVLLGVHGDMRFENYKSPYYGSFSRASPVVAGLIALCLQLLYMVLVSCQGFTADFWCYQAEACFWAGYWAEWWTCVLGDVLAEHGC